MKRSAFEQYYSALYMPLGMYALRLTGSLEDAEDIVQEAFSVMWEKVSQDDEPADFKAYIYRITRNASLARKGVAMQQTDLEESDVPAEDVDTSERDAALWEAIDSLPARCREIFLMSKRDGMSNKDIAEELSISVKTVENQMTKAFATLCGALRQSGGKVFFLPFL